MAKAIDMTGWIMKEHGVPESRYTVIRRATEEEYPRGSGKHAMWLCRCECGNEKFIASSDLRNGKTKSCACLAKEKAQIVAKELSNKTRYNLVGKRFGKLTVYKLFSTNPTLWLCKCDCGSLTKVLTANLINGHTTSYGCNRYWGDNHMSNGEEQILKILLNNNCTFFREYIFKDLKSSSGKNLRFDFAVFDNFNNLKYLIEVQGEQHYKQIKFFQKTKTDFLKRQEMDRKKCSYCLAHNISLYCIPYFELKNINNINDICQDKFLVKSKWHNDYLKEPN